MIISNNLKNLSSVSTYSNFSESPIKNSGNDTKNKVSKAKDITEFNSVDHEKIRSNRILELKNMIANKEYSVDIDSLADSIIEEFSLLK